MTLTFCTVLYRNFKLWQCRLQSGKEVNDFDKPPWWHSHRGSGFKIVWRR
jgi:hypothetical protein